MVPVVLLKFADLLGTCVQDHRLDIPEGFGRGYCEGFVLNEHLRLLISDYELKEDIEVKRPPDVQAGQLLFFKFQHIFSSAPSVLIATSRINTEEVFAIHSNTETINIEVNAAYLRGLLCAPEKSPLLQSLISDGPPLFFEQLIYPAIQKVLAELLTEKVSQPFRLFFLRVKTEELMCRLLMELNRRESRPLYPIHEQDIQALYRLKDQIFSQMNSPPVISKLAARANMSPAKLQRLFQQVFGDSIFHYYQAFRMQEAARLLREQKLSVSEVGYQLGFTNLSHFSRVFARHIGKKPKQYAILAK